MAFYIRKAFKTGPIRFNLSKSGLGLSAGVTGARVGISSRGLYVHGGRHGLYYRKYAGVRGKRSTGHKTVGSKNFDNESNRTPTPADTSVGTFGSTGSVRNTVSVFRDTGVTYPYPIQVPIASETITELADVKIISRPIKILVGTSVLLLMLSMVIEGATLLKTGALALTSSVIFWILWNYYWRSKSIGYLDAVIDALSENNNLPQPREVSIESLPSSWRELLHLNVHAVAGELAINSADIDEMDVMKELDIHYQADSRKVATIRGNLLNSFLDQLIEDHTITFEEEELFRSLISSINMHENTKSSLLQRVEYYGRVREAINRALEPIDVDVPLVRGESAYEVFKSVRMLNERVLHRFQRNSVQYRETGYEVETEGTLMLTDRRIILIGRGSREFRLNKILDITADPEAGVIELTVTDRKNPVVLTAPDILVVAARIEKAQQAIQ